MYYLDHRMSKDIDVFLYNPQYLNYFLPSLNSYLEGVATDYSNQANFIKIKLDSHEIDFIVSGNITGIKPKTEMINNFIFQMDHPFEIIAKKIFHRHDSFTIRDIFDLAMVYNSDGPNLINALSVIDTDIWKSLSARIKSLAQLEESTVAMKNIERLPNSKSIEEREFLLCNDFIDAIRCYGKL